MTRDPPASGGHNLQVQLAEAGGDRHRLADEAGREAVALGLKHHKRPAADDARNLSCAGNAATGRASRPSWPASLAIVRPLRWRRSKTATAHRSRSAFACPSDATGAVCHHDLVTYWIAFSTTPLALRPARGQTHTSTPSCLAACELCRDPVCAGNHDSRHLIGTPRPRRGAEATQHPVDRINQLRERHPLADHRAATARNDRAPTSTY
jgi:hypothetical protein